MKVLFSVLFVVTISFSSNGQILNKKDLKNAEWLSDNMDSLFFKSDTIKLIEYSYVISDVIGFNKNAEIEVPLLKHGYYIRLKFSKSGILDLWKIENNKISSTQIGDRKWEFDKKDNILRIYRDNLVEFILQPISSREVDIYSHCELNSENNPLKTREITMIKKK